MRGARQKDCRVGVGVALVEENPCSAKLWPVGLRDVEAQIYSMFRIEGNRKHSDGTPDAMITRLSVSCLTQRQHMTRSATAVSAPRVPCTECLPMWNALSTCRYIFFKLEKSLSLRQRETPLKAYVTLNLNALRSRKVLQLHSRAGSFLHDSIWPTGPQGT